MSKFYWEFPSNNDGAIDGFNDSGLRTFRDNLDISLAIREVIQNSLDAVNDPTKPVQINISIPQLEFSKFPDIDNFKDILNRCKDHKYAISDEKAQEFYSNALEEINNSTYCSMLKISDSNTTGMIPTIFEEVFIKGRGISQKSNNKPSAGSHGIGKNAIYNLSTFRTAFYSSLDTEGNRSFCGKSILQSHLKKNEETSQSIGFYAQQPGNKAITEEISTLSFLNNKKESGLDTFIVGFEEEEDTFDYIALAVIENFYPAIQEDKLEVKIFNKTINKNTLRKYIDQYSEKKYKKFYKSKHGQPNSFPLNKFYEALLCSEENDSKNVVEYSMDIYEKSDLLIKTIKNDGPNRVHYFRSSGMIIQTKKFNSPFNLTSIVHIQGDKLNNFIKKLENVSHDEWSHNQIDSKEDKAEGRRVLELIQSGLKETFEQFINKIPEESLDMSGAAKYLPDDLPEESDKKIDSEDGDENEKSFNLEHGELQIKKAPKKQARKNKDKNIKKYSPDDGEKGEHIPKDGGKGPKIPHESEPDDNGNIDKPDYQSYILNKSRLIKSPSDGKYTFLISIGCPGNIYLSLNPVSEDNSSDSQDTLEIIECSSSGENYEIKDNNKKAGPIYLKPNIETYIHVEIKEKMRMALEINAFIDKNE